MFQHDLQHTGLSGYAGISSPVLAWSYQTAGPVKSSPAIGSDGKVCFGSRDGYLYVVNSDASLAWSYRGGDDGFYDASPALGSGGKVYIGSTDSSLYVLNSNGSLAWSYKTGQRIYCSPPVIGTDGNVYVGSGDNNLYGINSNGSLAWSYETGGAIFISSPAIGADGRVYVGSDDCNLYAIGPTPAPTLTPTTTPTPTRTRTPAITPTRTKKPVVAPTATATSTPTPFAQVILNGTSFGVGSQFTATFQLNGKVTRVFNAYAVVNLPDRSMLDAITLSPQIRPLATNMNGLSAGFSYPLMSLTIPPGAPKGDCSVMVGFFDPNTRITGPNDAFLLATAPFTLE